MSSGFRLPKRRAIAIVADGPSAAVLRDIVIPQGIYVIAVNYAVTWVPRCDAYFTLDPDPRQRLIMRNQRPGVRYFAAVPPDYGSALCSVANHRGPREPNVTFLDRVEGPGPQSAAWGMNPDRKKINTGNSAWGALNLACHMEALRVALFGVDGSNESRTSGGKPHDLSHLPELFRTYDGRADVRNGSPRSAVDHFPRMGAHEAISWLV